MNFIKRMMFLLLGIALLLCGFGCAPQLREEPLSALATVTKEETESQEDTAEEEKFILPGEKGSFPLSLMSFNIRRPYDVDTGARSWKARREEIFRYLVSSGADVICLQEAPREYYEDLKTNLSDTFLFSENIPNLILVRKDKFEILEENSFFLSETPERKSIGWDAKNERSYQWVQLKNKENGAKFFVFNTHFDHMGVRARIESAKMVLEELGRLEYPYFLLGDLNCTEENYPHKILCSVLIDCSKEAAETDSGTTAHAWGEKADDAALPIDFILACPINIEVKKFRILRDKWGEGNFYSDHYAVFAETEVLY